MERRLVRPASSTMDPLPTLYVIPFYVNVSTPECKMYIRVQAGVGNLY